MVYLNIYMYIYVYTDFHGAVAYAYGGIFSWQMYGTADNIDDTGATYTVSVCIYIYVYMCVYIYTTVI